MFRTRYEELCNLIELHQSFDTYSKTYLLPNAIENKIENVGTVFKTEVKTFSFKIMEVMFESKLVDYQFVDRVYEFDRDLFEMALKTTIINVYGKIGFDTAVSIVRGLTYFLQAIIGYEAVCDQLRIDIHKHGIESNKLSKSLRKMMRMEEFSQIPENQRLRVEKMLSYLKLYASKTLKKSKMSDCEEEEVSYQFVSFGKE